MRTYSPTDWYWSGTLGVYGSARGALVASPSTDTAYQAFVGGNPPAQNPTAWPTDATGAETSAALDAVLTGVGLPATGLTPPTQAQLATAVVAAAIAASGSVVGQIFTDPAHQSAFQNAASIVNGNGGAAPSAGTLATKFAELAAVYGLTATAFATLVLALQGASLDLSTALSAVEVSAASATTSGQLATALAAFETAIGNVVTEINAASPPVPVIAAAAIVIKGVNA